ncbi:hypothetical protein VNO77_50183 [Canavalia gladiata]|uniref:Uncharacterized protein n=1 Tax=Canavalia gladiata TaxID=3824 RepID=A0AAN9JEW9_CANGL
MKEGQKNYRTTPTRAKGDRRDLRESVPHSARKLGGVSYEGPAVPSSNQYSTAISNRPAKTDVQKESLNQRDQPAPPAAQNALIRDQQVFRNRTE